MLFISITFSLFALMAGMLLLAKSRKEELGNFFTWMSYLVIVVSLLVIICESSRGIMRMTCRPGMYPHSECCMPAMMDNRCGPDGGMMMHQRWMGSDGRCMEEMRECGMKGDSGSHKMRMGHGCPMDEEEVEKDTVKK